ncbi:hypothetical protein AUI06_03110 [archaeon 13_2_20CM_2_52_21]|nr:MAG: hypothetical protein AUI06_03110 [archaeon 13_2_20CM_2_52_21]
MELNYVPSTRGKFELSSNIEHLLAKSIDDLYEELGRSLITPDYPLAGTVTRQNAVQRGKSFISGSLEKLRAKICVDWHYCNKRSGYADFQSLAYAVAPLVSSVVGVPATTGMIVAIILIKSGLEKLCNCP